jgi:type IV secretory pathway TrbD component
MSELLQLFGVVIGVLGLFNSEWGLVMFGILLFLIGKVIS